MVKHIIVALFCLALPLAATGQGSAPVLPPPDMSASSAAIVIAFDRTGAQQTRVLRGFADRSTQRLLTADDPVRVASISKLVTALGAMRLVDQRRLDLNADVSRYLGWRLRHPAHPDRPITLAMLLGHRSGLVDGVDYVLPLDADLETVLANPAAWDRSRAPGGAFAYANINFPVIAAAMEGATGERFDALMARVVFRPLGLDACFNWTMCSDGAAARAVTLLRPNGDVARDAPQSLSSSARPACPVVPARDGSCDLTTYRLAHSSATFSPQGGLRISARGLVRIGEILLREGDRFITPRSFRRMTAVGRVDALPAAVGEGGEGSFFCRYGLALHQLATARTGCRDDPFGDGVTRIGHSGDAYSLRAGLFVDPLSGTGTMWFITQLAETGEPLGARSAFTAAEEALLAEARVAIIPVSRRR
ncbi:MAG: serine hydrolase domain-containing protein [Sphingopyxis sp.]